MIVEVDLSEKDLQDFLSLVQWDLTTKEVYEIEYCKLEGEKNEFLTLKKKLEHSFCAEKKNEILHSYLFSSKAYLNKFRRFDDLTKTDESELFRNEGYNQGMYFNLFARIFRDIEEGFYYPLSDYKKHIIQYGKELAALAIRTLVELQLPD